MMTLKKPVSQLFMVGPTYAKRLEKLEIKNLNDFLYHFPFRYLDYRLTTKINQIQPGKVVSLQAKIESFENKYLRSRRTIQEATIKDETGTAKITWFNQPFLTRVFKKGTFIGLAGKAKKIGSQITFTSPEYEITSSSSGTKKPLHTQGLVPVYHETYGVSSKWLRSRLAPLLKETLPFLKDFLPLKILKKHGLVDLKKALQQIHFPSSPEATEEARKRLAFEELFLFQLAALVRKKAWQKKKLTYPLKIKPNETKKFLHSLPFELTNAQKRSLQEILADLAKKRPMNRLLQGDVGSGKTVVAAGACLMACLNKTQAAIMAPTEILAQQHFKTLSQLLTPLGVKVSLLTASQKKAETDFDLVVGTHALINKRAKFKKLALVVVDEQHRFGVEQRSKLLQENKTTNQIPHLLTMTATPIPRTIALTLYGDLELSFLDEMPPGRKKTKTWVVPPQKRKAAYEWTEKQIKKQQSQAFIVCPLIEESESETLKDVRAVTSEFEKLKKEIFPKLKIGLLHGRLKSEEKNKVLTRFKKGRLDILVATPVVEVGIDIPTATIMIIEAAERFGLAQLHQLRGRVGRGEQQSFCLIFNHQISRKSLKRLKALERTNSGMELAELDLTMRGPGEIYGLQQHGFSNLKVASFNDVELIKKTNQAAEKIVDQINHYPRLQERLKEATIGDIKPN